MAGSETPGKGGPIPARKLVMGRIGAAHGVRGEVRIQSFTEDPMALLAYKSFETARPGVSLVLLGLKTVGKGLVGRFQSISDRNAAERLNGLELLVDRSRLPEAEDEDEFYLADLVGLSARLSDGRNLGMVTAVHNHGAGDIIEVGDARSGDNFLYPFTRAVVPEVHIAEGYLVIEPPIETEADPDEANEDGYIADGSDGGTAD
ncbi:16S rRNA processing protein RimM [Devosia enhydra]|uniref:Ribosome maturation factor RimM n=2 Tax=Devosia enhydra TaxID=665118 RepID=A0A1K2HZ21_9HYPH|nr:16S rRNA processing protein RimM [Devosia enhydra]